MQISRGKASLQGQPKLKKSKQAAAQHLSATYQVYTTGGDRGGAGCRVWEAHSHPVCEVTHTAAGAQLHSLFRSFTPLMSAPNRGGKKKRREGGKKPSEEGRKQEEGVKKGREKADFLGGLGLPTWVSVPRSLVLTAGQLWWGHSPLWTCLSAFLHGQEAVLSPHIPWPALISATGSLSFALAAAMAALTGKNFASLPLDWAIGSKQRALPGTTPLALLRKNALSSTPLLSNICLPPVRLKLATSVPLAVLTCARCHAHSLKTHSAWWHGQDSTPLISPQNHECGSSHLHKV